MVVVDMYFTDVPNAGQVRASTYKMAGGFDNLGILGVLSGIPGNLWIGRIETQRLG